MLAAEFAVTFEDITVETIRGGDRTRVLGPLTGCVKSRQVCCVVGPPDQASFFLDAIRGHTQYCSAGFAHDGQYVTGTITWNGQNPRLVDHRVIAYVNQSQRPTVYADHLSVWDILLITVKVRVPHLPQAEQVAMTEMVLDMINLQGKGDLSFMDLDPVSTSLLTIGRELIGCSGILLLREPTQGLSPADAQEVIQRLHFLAEQHQYAIIFSSSQACSGIFGHLTDVMVLSICGVALFQGPAQLAQQVFSFHGHHSPPDFNFLEFILGQVCDVSDSSRDALVIFAADSDFAKAKRRAASEIRAGNVKMPTLIERKRQAATTEEGISAG